MQVFFKSCCLGGLLLLLTVNVSAGSDAMSDKARLSIATEAYHYFYPMVSMEMTRQVLLARKDDDGNYEAMNRISHLRKFPAADFKAIVRPNFDTLYSTAWLDLSDGPVVIHVPEVPADRYYMLELLDMWTDAFAVPGSMTVPAAGAKIAVTPPGWQGELPADLIELRATTPVLWLLGRTQTNGPKDYEAVHKIQDGYRLTTLDGKPATGMKGGANANVDGKTPTLQQVDRLSGQDFFAMGFDLLETQGAHASDWDMVQRLKLAGLNTESVASGRYDGLLEKAKQSALAILNGAVSTMGGATLNNGWSVTTSNIGVYGNDYFKRALVTKVGLGANPANWAVYPVAVVDSKGQRLKGGIKYKVHFAADKLPPVTGFWSITMYDTDGYQIANSINRFAIGDRDDLTFNPDGSLDIWIQPDAPVGDKAKNWLPSPASGGVGITMRLYGPEQAILFKQWLPPAIEPVK